jgi:hypothetical protein
MIRTRSRLRTCCVRTRFLVRALWGVAATVALLCVGCGGVGDGDSALADSQTSAAPLAESSQAYRDELTVIVSGPDQARRNYHNASLGEATVTSARQLARASRAAAHQVEELTPAAGLNDLNRDLAEKYRRWAAALEREVLRKPVSTRRLGDVVREYGKAADDVYEQILIAP